MKKLGKVTIVSKKGDLLVRVTKTYRMYTQVVNQQIKKVGKIVDIIGPATSPYLVINTRNSEAKATKGDMLYMIERDQKKSSTKYRSKQSPKKGKR